MLDALPASAAPKRRAPAARRPARKAQPKAKSRPAPAPVEEPVPAQPQFLRDVAPILDRSGCSAAACHGKFGGRGDLAISLLTLSPEDDYDPIVLGSRGRRVNLQEPEKSLLLLKAAGEAPHGGGSRFNRKSREYRTLLTWLKNGAPFTPQDARLTGLAISPEKIQSQVGKKSQVKVIAHWSDGSKSDVTRQAMYASADEPVATVDDEGQITAQRWGLTAIQARFLGQIRAAFITLPRQDKGATARAPKQPRMERANLIDEAIFSNLERLNVQPSVLTSDAEFLRRVYLDTLGRLPEPAEQESFAADQGPDRRARLIDALLERPEWVDLRTLRIADLLRLNPRKINNNAAFGQRSTYLFHEWIRSAVARNQPWNQFVRELLGSRGSLYQNGPASFWAVERTPNDRAETVGQAFLGVRLGCARCHKHPFDRWTTDDYWNFSAFHGTVGLRNMPGGAFGEQEVFYNPGARVVNQSVNGPSRGLPAVPTFLGEKPLDEEARKADVSLRLAAWVTADDNAFFARATVNRLWSNYFGRGLIHPVDDMRDTTPESVPGLLDALAREFIRTGYDIKGLVRLMLNSRSYQLSSLPNPTNELDDRFYSRFYPRPMLAQVMLDVLNQASGISERLTPFPLTRAVELPIPTNNFFLNVFGQSHRLYLTDLDPRLEPNLVQTLHLMNSSYVNGKIRGGQWVREAAKSMGGEAELVRRTFIRTLCREPLKTELDAAMAIRPTAKNRQEWLEDLVWSILASREFLFIS